MKTIQPPYGRKKQANRACGPLEMRPFFLKGAHHGLCPLSEATQPLARAKAQGHTPLCAEGAGPYGSTAAPPNSS